jgi:cytosine/adenosine deaminase-related metal-dependent hydrolase
MEDFMTVSGFVNAHTHLELGALLGAIPAGLEFSAWIWELVKRKRALTERDYLEAIDAGIRTLHETGSVGVGDISSNGLSVVPLLESGLAGVVYYEVLGMDEQGWQRFEAAQRLIDGWRAREGRMRVGLSIHTPYTASARLLEQGAAWCRAEQVPLSIHLAESPAETRFFQAGDGPILELNQRFYPDFRWPAPGCSPVQYLERLGVLAARPLLFHGVEVDEQDLASLARAGCAMVHCPRSNLRLGCGRMPLERYLEHGIVVALGTDSLASAPSLDLREELRAAGELHGERVSAQALQMIATEGGARALGIT